MRTVATIVAVVLLASGCSGGDTETGPEFPTGKFAQAVQERIDTAAAEGDCAALQDEFDLAEENGSDGFVDLMDYIDDKLEKAGCYE